MISPVATSNEQQNDKNSGENENEGSGKLFKQTKPQFFYSCRQRQTCCEGNYILHQPLRLNAHIVELNLQKWINQIISWRRHNQNNPHYIHNNCLSAAMSSYYAILSWALRSEILFRVKKCSFDLLQEHEQIYNSSAASGCERSWKTIIIQVF